MDLKELYYRLRPLARVQAEQRLLWAESEHSKKPFNPVIGFALAALFSFAGGLFGGFSLWISLGFSPETSGGTFVFIGGSMIMSLISVFAYAIWKHRGVFYGLNAFTGLTLIGLFIDVCTALLA